MSEFPYDVAISFAGEQRQEAQRLAKCLKENRVSVFFDEFQAAELWGKDLFEHLSAVYMRQAQYCIIFASEAYSRKVWTTHERKSAQARALEEKGKEYILPVRFDQTPIPGINPTVGYLDFQRYGVDGVCNAFIKKLRNQPIAVAELAQTCSSSSLAAILIAERNLKLYVPVLQSSFHRERADLVVVPAEPDEHSLNLLKRLQEPVVVAYKHDVALCKVASVVYRTVGGVGQFQINVEVLKDHFTPSMEPGIGSTTKDQLAEKRTRRLLLNENPARRTSDINEIFREVLLAGQGTLTRVEKSHFPDLYSRYRSDSHKFLEVAWIDAMMLLKTSACVSDVQKLSLKVVDNKLEIDFVGQREKDYMDRPPYEIRVRGTIELA